MSGQRRNGGLLLAAFGTLAITPDAVLLRSIGAVGVDVRTLIFWKSFLVSIMSFVLTASLNGGIKATLHGMASGPTHLALGTVFQMMMTLGFTVAVLLADTARALAFLSLNPLVAALLGWLILGERIPLRTMAALGASVAAVAFIVYPQLTAPPPSSGAAAERTWRTVAGEAVAFATGCALASFLTCSRHAALHRPLLPTQASTAIGSLCVASLVLTLSLATGNSLEDAVRCTAHSQPALLRALIPDAQSRVAGGHAEARVVARRARRVMRRVCVRCPRPRSESDHCGRGLAHLSRRARDRAVLGLPALRRGAPSANAATLPFAFARPSHHTALWSPRATLAAHARQVPSAWTFGGGGMLICTLVVHELFAIREARRQSNLPGGGLKEPFLSTTMSA
jgi:drug/metabolite transporter (DMT)-like permease